MGGAGGQRTGGEKRGRGRVGHWTGLRGRDGRGHNIKYADEALYIGCMAFLIKDSVYTLSTSVVYNLRQLAGPDSHLVDTLPGDQNFMTFS